MPTMETRIDEVAAGIFRIATFTPEFQISFNQFLIVDERPALIHTGIAPAFDQIRATIAKVIDPAKLEFIVIPHFEADECGGMSRFIAQAPKATLIPSELGAVLNLSGWDYVGPYKGMRDGDTLELGSHKLRFLETPHVHHWDSMMVYEETTGGLFPADLFLQPGEQPPIVRENLGREMCAVYREVGIFGGRDPVLQTADRIARLAPKMIHPMHGGSLAPEIIPKYMQALQTERFWYEGKLFGRKLPT